MASYETPFYFNLSNKKENKEFFKLARKMLYKKYTYEKNSYKKIFTNYLIFNIKCRLTLFYKESLLSDNSCEYFRHFYPKEDIKVILNKILEIYCLYSKIYPNYIILPENKFLYKNIRKKQKIIDENNNEKEINKNKLNDKLSNNDNELFTLSVRNEIKEFEDISYSIKNNIDNSSKKIINITNTKKIIDNSNSISNKNNNLNINKKVKKISNSQSNKNISCDSFWTNDTNNLSILINAINDKIIIEEIKKNKKECIIRNKGINNINTSHKFSKAKNQKSKEIKTSSKKNLKKIIYKKIDKKNIRDNSRNNNFLKIQSKKYLNYINTANPLVSTLSNSSNLNSGLIYKGNNLHNQLLTDNTLEKGIKNNIHQYYSIEKNSDRKAGKNLKKFIPGFVVKKKFYSKDFSCVKKKNKNYLLKKMEIMNNKYDFDKYIRKKSSHQEFLKKIIMNNSNKNCLYEESIKEEKAKNSSYNNKILYKTNNNFNKLRNLKFFKKYFTNNNIDKNNLTVNNSETLINSRKEKEFNSTCMHRIKNKNNKNINDNINDINTKTIINLQISNNYYISKNKNIKNISKNKYSLKKQKTENIVSNIRDKILKKEVGAAYIRKKCFSPISSNIIKRNSLIKSCDIKNKKKFSIKFNENLIQKDDMRYKLIDIRKNNRKEYIQYDTNTIDNNYLNNKSINKINFSNNNLIKDISHKQNKKNLNILNLKQNIRNKKKINSRKTFSPTFIHNNLYNLNIKDLSNFKNYINYNNSEFIDNNHENLLKKRNSLITSKINIKAKLNKLENKENIYNLNNQKIGKYEEKNYNMIKSKTHYENFMPKYIYINKPKNFEESSAINRNYILKRFQIKNKNLSKDKNIKDNNEIVIKRFNNLSNSTINNYRRLNEYTTIRNINNSLSNSMQNITEFQTPLINKKRLKLIRKFIYADKQEKIGQNYNIENISSKIVIKVNRDKFLEKVKEKMKNKTISINLNIKE